MAREVIVHGDKELRRALKRMGDDLSDLKDIHRASGEVVAGRARELVPRKTGRLAGSIRVSATKTRAGVRAGRKLVPYAGPIHFGWPRHHIEPHPFLFDALDDRRTEVVDLYNSRVEALVRRVGIETPP